MYHVPVFVLTNYARPPLVMEGGTTFNFVTEGAVVALERAREAAGRKDVRLGGGVDVIQQYLRHRLTDACSEQPGASAEHATPGRDP